MHAHMFKIKNISNVLNKINMHPYTIDHNIKFTSKQKLSALQILDTYNVAAIYCIIVSESLQFIQKMHYNYKTHVQKKIKFV